MKKGFTLAEILITLGIVGVVAALTIPMLMQSSKNKELVAGVLKADTTLSNALKDMERAGNTKVNKLADLNIFHSLLLPHLNTIQCDDAHICTADGIRMAYASSNFTGKCDETEPCVVITVDVNGKKTPNTEGRDVYDYLVTNKGIVPKGDVDTCSGLDCTAYVVAHHKLYEGGLKESTQKEEEKEEEQKECDAVVGMAGYNWCARGKGFAVVPEENLPCENNDAMALYVKDGDFDHCKPIICTAGKWKITSLREGLILECAPID